MKKNKKTNDVGKVSKKPEQLFLAIEDAAILKDNENNILKSKLRLADVEIAIANFNAEKAELINLIKSEQNVFVDNARKFALKNGIDPDGEPSKEQWNLDTATMSFNKLK
jgi:hypothetical protein